MKSIKFSTNLISIGSWSFYRCSKLTTVDLSICLKLQTVEFEAFDGCNIRNLKLPSSLTNIKGNAFAFNDFNISFYIAKTLTIDLTAFGASIVYYDVDPDHSLYKMYKGCIYDPTFTKLLQVSADVTEIEYHPSVSIIAIAAYSTSLVKSIKLPDTIVDIEQWGIHDARNLEILILSPNIKIHNQFIVYQLYNLKELVIPEGITSIPRLSFYLIPSLKHIILPSSAKIEIEAFVACRVKKAFVIDQNKIQEYITGGIQASAFIEDQTCAFRNHQYLGDFKVLSIIIFVLV